MGILIPLSLFAQSEFLLDTNVVYVPAPGDQYYPSVAFDGSNYFVVWGAYLGGISGVLGARVTSDGIVLDPGAILISSNGLPYTGGSSPVVAFDGTNYIVVWQQGASTSADIYGARVTPDGIVIDTTGIPICTSANLQKNPAVAFDGTNYLVVWKDDRNGGGMYGGDIYGARVTPDGTVIDPDGIPICTVNNPQWTPAVAFDGTNYLVVWSDWRSGYCFNIYCARVSPDGVVLDPQGILLSNQNYNQWDPTVAFDGTNYLVVWEDVRASSANPGIYGARVTTSGTVLDPGGFPISLFFISMPDYVSSTIAFDGTNYLVVWSRDSDRNIYGARVTPDGSVLGSFSISAETNDQLNPALAFDGINYLVVWDDARNSGYTSLDIYGARVNTSGTVLDPDGICISVAGNCQNNPSTSFDGTNYLVVWQDFLGEDCDIYGVRVSQNGTLLEPSAIPISTAEYDQIDPSIIFGGTNYIVVWADTGNGDDKVYCARMSPDGIVLDPGGIFIANAGAYPYSPNFYPWVAVSFDNTNYFIVWADYRNGNWDIYAARVAQDGVVLDPGGIPIRNTNHREILPAVAFDGTNYLVVWQEMMGGTDSINGALVNQDGIVLDTIPICTNSSTAPSVAFDGTNYFVVWTDWRNSSSQIYGARVSPSGTVLDPQGIHIGGDYAMRPSVAFDGTNYLVVWQQGGDIYGGRVSTEGVVIDSFVVSNQFGEQTFPVVAHGLDNQLLIVYSGFTDYVNNHSANTWRIWGKFYPFTSVEETDLRTTPHALHSLEVHPNPFRNHLTIKFQIPNPKSKTNSKFQISNETEVISSQKSVVSIRIYDATGCLVKLFNHLTIQPFNQVVWDGTDDYGHRLPSGVYFVRLETGEYRQTEKVILIK